MNLSLGESRVGSVSLLYQADLFLMTVLHSQCLVVCDKTPKSSKELLRANHTVAIPIDCREHRPSMLSKATPVDSCSGRDVRSASAGL